MGKRNSISPQVIVDINGTPGVLNVPPITTQIHNDGPTTDTDRSILDGQCDIEVKDHMQSDMNQKKKKRKKRKKKKHRTNGDTFSHMKNDDQRVFDGRTGHPDGAGQDNETKPKKGHTKARSHQESEKNIASSELEYHSNCNIGTPARINDNGKTPDEPNDKIQDTQRDIREQEQHEKMSETNADLNEVNQEHMAITSVNTKKHKKRKKSRERSKEKVHDEHEESRTKHKRKRRKRDKKKDDGNAVEQGLNIETDENDKYSSVK